MTPIEAASEKTKMIGPVLVGMETSGRTRDALRRRGVNAISADILPTVAGGPHIQGDVFEVIDRDPVSGLPWRAALFHPTCTYHVVSAAWAFSDPDFERYPGVGYHQKVKPETLVGVDRRTARLDAEIGLERIRTAPIPFKFVENPRGTIPTRLKTFGPPCDVLQPFEFGDDASKATCIWAFGSGGEKLPARFDRRSDLYVKPRLVCAECGSKSDYDEAFGHGCGACGAEAAKLKPRWANQTDSGQNNLSPKSDRWSARSETYQGIADALADKILSVLMNQAA